MSLRCRLRRPPRWPSSGACVLPHSAVRARPGAGGMAKGLSAAQLLVLPNLILTLSPFPLPPSPSLLSRYGPARPKWLGTSLSRRILYVDSRQNPVHSCVFSFSPSGSLIPFSISFLPPFPFLPSSSPSRPLLGGHPLVPEGGVRRRLRVGHRRPLGRPRDLRPLPRDRGHPRPLGPARRPGLRRPGGAWSVGWARS